MREQIKFWLTRMPGLYQRIIRLKNRKEYDNERIVFLNAVHDGDVVCDVGANRGIHTVLLSNIVGAGGEVHAFEPVPPTFKMLSDNVAAKKRFNNIKLVNTAMGDKPGMVTINLPAGDDGQASMAKHSAGSWKDAREIVSHECKVNTLDLYFAAMAKRPPAFIKCDVEGAEMLAMRGASETLAKHKPVLFLEICKEWTRGFDYTPRDLLHFIQQFGYDTFHIVDNGIRPVKDPEGEMDEGKLSESVDLLCAVKGLHGNRLGNLY